MIENQPLTNRSFLKNMFLYPDEPRLRAGWRLVLQTAIMLTLGICLSVLFLTALLVLDPSLLATFTDLKPEYMLLGMVAETFAVTVSVFLARRFLDKRSIESLGLQLSIQTLFDILMGIFITFLQMGLIYFLMSQLGWITFQGFAWQFDPLSLVLRNTLLFIVIFILVAWNEELLSRGYHLQTIASGTNIFWGVMISSAVFGLLHLGNPGANWTSTLGIFLAGIFFAFGYLRTKQLWLPMGMHLGWNFFEGVGFGFPVSGLDIYPLTRIQVHGPELWTGGPFGPEAGLIILPALLLGVLLIHLYVRNRTVSS
ncbi:MAG TPA: type II CAAX endopeptidase family protein [Anaerolineales bacterium]|nr:type II CAAX endopeptidase family protein [Anaerolineales bacterium]